MSSKVSIWHDPPLVLRKVFLTPPVVDTYDGLTPPGKKKFQKRTKTLRIEIGECFCSNLEDYANYSVFFSKL